MFAGTRRTHPNATRYPERMLGSRAVSNKEWRTMTCANTPNTRTPDDSKHPTRPTGSNNPLTCGNGGRVKSQQSRSGTKAASKPFGALDFVATLQILGGVE